MQDRNRLYFWVFLGLTFIGLIYLLSPILTPFVASALIAYLANPLINKLCRLHLPRLASVLIVFSSVFIIIIILLLLLIPLIEKQIVLFINTLPAIFNWLQGTLSTIMLQFNIKPIDIASMKNAINSNLSNMNNIASWFSKKALYSGLAIINFFVNLFLIPVVTFYLMRDWKTLLHNIKILIPTSIAPTVTKLATDCDKVLAAFLRGQLMVMLSLGIIYSIGLGIIGLNLSLLIGLIAGLASIVPYLGFIVGISIASITAYLQFQSLTAVGLVFIVFLIGQALEGSVLTPVLVGNKVGLHPVAVIFAIMAGGVLFGFFGVLLAVPAAAVIMVLIRYFEERYLASELYKSSS